MSQVLRLPDTRWGAFAGHLAISAAIFAALFALIAFVLFPGALFWVAGGVEGIRIIAGVDIVLGPLLTLVIYNIAKPRRELYRDLAIIASVQIAALAAGMLVVYSSRPVVVAWVYDTFSTLKAADFTAAAVAPPDGLSALTPMVFYVRLPESDADARSVVATHELAQEPMRLRTDLYAPFPTGSAEADKVMRGKGVHEDAGRKSCKRVDIVTAFDATQVCYVVSSQRFER